MVNTTAISADSARAEKCYRARRLCTISLRAHTTVELSNHQDRRLDQSSLFAAHPCNVEQAL